MPLERRFRAQRLHRIAGDEGKRGNSNPRQCAFGNCERETRRGGVEGKDQGNRAMRRRHLHDADIADFD